ncbi:hypothetical protein GCM10010218_56060 [Streptomyces mashuensis]|uniref:Uncharacterized protein n=1 Tax=Streptomyces mashuensis TaxID=33904 RepID=A0A919B870_9ACTN|nr:hypothetical protein [Streptomyces mashuensis]GHF67364.1 hypothetical protein GCM10010218_56060 [Streptomyces mashuensis]
MCGITGLTAAAGDAGAPLGPYLDGAAVARLTGRTTAGSSLSELERILVESTVRLDAWLRAYGVELTGVEGAR